MDEPQVRSKLTESFLFFQAFPDIAGALPPKEIPKVNPPIRRFMELENPADLRLGEVLELLKDYRRLASALKDIGAIKD